MGKYKKILVAVDGSESCRNAFRQACRIAREDGRRITAVTAVPSLVDQFETLSVAEKAAYALRQQGEKVLSEISKLAEEEGVILKTLLEEGSPHEVIAEAAEDGGYDLIVMGRVGKTRLQKTLVGSVTARVIGIAGADVLVVQRNTALGWGRMLLPTDGSKHSNAAAERAVELAGSYGGEMTAVSVVDVNEEFYANAPEAVDRLIKKAKSDLDGVRKKATSAGVKVETLVREGEAFRAIIDTAKDKNSNVIVMGSHGRTGLGRLLMGSVTEKVIGHTPCPVLVVKR